MNLSIVQGDITQFHADAIVNAANTSLLGGAGVDGAIHRVAGPGLMAECKTLNGCPTGEARITKGYNLKAAYVIHTPGPRYAGGNRGEAQLLESCYRNCLLLAMEHGIREIAFPSISTGIYRFPLREAAEIAVRTIMQYPQMDVTMVCFDPVTREAYEAALENCLREAERRKNMENLQDTEKLQEE